jgi:hypothetical protein
MIPAEPSATLFYKTVMRVSAATFLGLSLFLFFAPRTFLGGLGLDLTASTDFLCRRASVLLLALAVLSLAGRNAASGAARQALALALFVATAVMAVLGVAEYVRGATTVGIFKAVAVEVALAVCFLLVWLRGRAGAGR